MAKKFSYTRSRWETFQNCQYRLNIDQSTDVEPGLATEVSDLFKQLDESGKVNNFAFSGDQPITVYGGDIAENPTTYQGAYERYENGEPPQGESQKSVASEAQQANAAELPQGEQQQSS